MKFFYIDNTLCTACDRCTAACATGAVYAVGERRMINYERCTSCGCCMRECASGAVTLESLDRVTREIEKTEQYKNYIERIEHELMQLKEQARQQAENMAEMIEAFTSPAFIADERMRIVVAGSAFVDLLDIPPTLLSDMPARLAGQGVASLLDAEVVRRIEALAADRQTSSFLATVASHQASVCVTPLTGGHFMCVVRDLGRAGAVGEEVSMRLRQAIEQQLSTVQKIGFMLGEGMSEVVANLTSVVDMIEHSPSKKDN